MLYLECDGCGYAIGNDPERYKDKTLMAKIVPSGGFFSLCCLLFASITRKSLCINNYVRSFCVLEIVCQHCGVKGFEDALTLCEKCGEYALHRYCLEVLPEDLSKPVVWFCEDCKPDILKQSTPDKPSSSSSAFSVSVDVESPKTVQPNKRRGRLKKTEKVITGLETNTEVQTHEDTPSGIEPHCRENQMLRRRLILEDEEDLNLETSQVAVSNSKASNVVEERVSTGSEAKTEEQMCEGKPFGNVSQLKEKSDNEQKLGTERRLVREDEEAKPSSTLEQRVFTSCTVPKAEAQIFDGRSSGNKSQCREESDRDQKFKRQHKTLQCSDPKPSNILQHKVIASCMDKTKVQIRDGEPSGNMPKSREKCDSDQTLTKTRRLVLSNEEAERVKTSQVTASDPTLSSILQDKDISRSVAKTKVQKRDGNYKHQNFSEHNKTSLVSDPKPLDISQQNAVTGSVAKWKVQIHDSSPSSCELRYRSKFDKSQTFSKQKTYQVSDSKPLNVSQRKTITGTVAKAEVGKHGRPSRSEPQDGRGKRDNYQKAIPGSVAKTKVQICDSRPYHSELQYRGKYDKDQTFRKRQRLPLEDDEEHEPSKASQNDVNDPKLSNLEQNYYLDVQPMIDPIWNGTLRISNRDLNTPEILSVAAHLSNLACHKVFEVAKLLPEEVSLELSKRSHFWPKSFRMFGPSCHHIALYFFPDNGRDDNVFNSLVDGMIKEDLAMRAVLKEAELLVFTSYDLPMHMRSELSFSFSFRFLFSLYTQLAPRSYATG
ncbi:hypothetical protein L484_000507 [Morus notabilis]|uniref:AIPP2-like SPOC-like domain-containing protein n=1 Tax=Morus notabilis TaxID=981085 RepID=W9SDN7_9ROSA|nr:hypothetical protein L484_000507 [Morus notabilis]